MTTPTIDGFHHLSRPGHEGVELKVAVGGIGPASASRAPLSPSTKPISRPTTSLPLHRTPNPSRDTQILARIGP
jgi:hypothetical protein